MPWEHFTDHWAKVKPNLSFKQLPMLEVNGRHQIFQSIAILKFLEHKAGLLISDPIQEAKAMANAILQSAQELFATLDPTVNFAVDDDFLSKRDAMRPMLANPFEELSNCLAENGSKFFIDDRPRAAEFATFHHLDISKKLDDSLIKQFPQLERLVDDMISLQGMLEYLLLRPTLIGVGRALKLVIDGIEHSTGVEQT
tara:strand:+ start:72 stop:665 length:594 start_codon:yes stop_codon:yes gene_type:complete